jgi:hypothetical protein
LAIGNEAGVGEVDLAKDSDVIQEAMAELRTMLDDTGKGPVDFIS